MVTDREFLHQGEDVEVVRKQILVLFLVGEVVGREARTGGIVHETQFSTDRESRNEVRILEIESEVAVFGNVSQQLEGHENVFVTGHRGQNSLWRIVVAQEGRIGVRSKARRVGIIRSIGRRKSQGASRLGIGRVDYAAVHGRSVGDIEGFSVLSPRRVVHG